MPLYKYIVPDRIDILQRGQIRFTPPGALNDPFELRPFFEHLMTNDEVREMADSDELQRQTLVSIRREYDKLPLPDRRRVPWLKYRRAALEVLRSQVGHAYETSREMLPIYDAELRKQLPDFIQHFGILSLAARPDSMPMWAHYAQQHEGFVLEFDDQDPWFHRGAEEDDFFHLRQVRYLDPPEPLPTFSQLDTQALPVTKKAIWAYEEEWRMIVPLRTADRVIGEGVGAIHLFDLPSSAVRGVILGTHSTPELLSSIRRIREARSELRHLQIRQARQDDRTGHLLIEEL